MTKIDESKQYKFSEIIAMLENKELPEETVISIPEKVSIGATAILLDINSLWSIKLPKEDKFYLKAPKMFCRTPFLNYNKKHPTYFLGGQIEMDGFKTKFTQNEIDSMPFDTTFFEQGKVEVESND